MHVHVAAGVRETSDVNPDAASLQRSYAEGRQLAALHEMEDYETVLKELQAFPVELEDFKKHTPDKLLFRDIWYAMFLSGMTPWEHLDRHIVDAGRSSRRVELVDMPRPKLAELAQCASPSSLPVHLHLPGIAQHILCSVKAWGFMDSVDGSTTQGLTWMGSLSTPNVKYLLCRQMFGENLSEEDERKESQGFLELMHEQARKTMPLYLPEDVWHIMAPAALAPEDMPNFFQKLAEVAPCSFELMVCLTFLSASTANPSVCSRLMSHMMTHILKVHMLQKCRAAYMTRALDTLAKEGIAGSGTSERHIVCLVDRMVEPLLRLQWDELQNVGSSDMAHDTLVQSLPFLPKPLRRAKAGRHKRRK